jgi:hypothetical protein
VNDFGSEPHATRGPGDRILESMHKPNIELRIIQPNLTWKEKKKKKKKTFRGFEPNLISSGCQAAGPRFHRTPPARSFPFCG